MLCYTTFIKYNFNSFTTMLRFALLNIELQNLWVSSFIYYCLFILFSRPTRYKICVTENVNQGHWTSDTLKLRLKSKLVKLINKYSSSKDVNVSGWGVEGACARVGALPPHPTATSRLVLSLRSMTPPKHAARRARTSHIYISQHFRKCSLIVVFVKLCWLCI